MHRRKVASLLATVGILAAACSSTPATSGGAPATGAPASSLAASGGTAASSGTAASPSTAGESPSTASGSTAPSGSAANLPTTVGAGEGALNLVAWAGYVVGGTGGEKVPDGGIDWVTPFEQQTGCKVKVTVGVDSANMVQLMKTGQFDGVSASGDATLRLIAGGDVSPVNTALTPNYKDVFDGLKNQSYNTVNGQGYGVPHGRGANVLMSTKSAVNPAPDSWSVVFDPNSAYKGKVTAYNYAIYIADAAMYLMATKPELGIKNPYALDDTQFAAAVDLLKQQKSIIGKYWVTAQDEIDGFANGDMVVGSAWQYQANTINADKDTVGVTLPKEGATGWSDTWMISSVAKHPNCMYMWMDYIISPKANANVTVSYGEAPVSAPACAEAEKLSKGHCDTFHANDEAYFKNIWYWNTPTANCLDGRGAI